MRSILQPSRALAVAGLKQWVSSSKKSDFTDDVDDDDEFSTELKLNLVAILSGANTNLYLLRVVSERAEIGEGRKVVFEVTITECTGTFRKHIQ